MKSTPYHYRGPRDPGDGETECPACCGGGEVIDYSRVHGGSIDPPMSLCQECHGTGCVEAEYACCRCGEKISEDRRCKCEDDTCCESCCDCEVCDYCGESFGDGEITYEYEDERYCPACFERVHGVPYCREHDAPCDCEECGACAVKRAAEAVCDCGEAGQDE